MDERTPPASNVVAFPLGRQNTHAAGRASYRERFTRRAERRASVLFAELRGGHAATDAVGSVQAQATLTQVIDATLEILTRLGAREVTLDGGPIRPMISATFEGQGHALRAVRAADAIRSAAAAYQSRLATNRRLQACTGVNTGEVAELALGEEDLRLFESVGTLRSFAGRLQEFAGPGQILLSSRTYEEVRRDVSVRALGGVRVDSSGQKDDAFALAEILATSEVGEP